MAGVRLIPYEPEAGLAELAMGSSSKGPVGQETRHLSGSGGFVAGSIA